MKNPKIIICDLDHKDIEPEKAVFNKAGYDFLWLHCKTQDDVIKKCQGAVVLLNQYIKMDEKIFKKIPSLKCIVRYGVGVDNIHIPDATSFGIQICNIPDYGTCEVADQALALMMGLTRKIVKSTLLIRAGIWNYQEGMPMYRFRDMTIGICGVGRIGSEFAKRAQALGSKIIAYDIEYNRRGRTFPENIEFVSFDELLQKSDILSIHCPLGQDTYHLFSTEEFTIMKSSAYIINVARGGIIDEDALYMALKNKEIAGAGIDVAEHEPMTMDNPLLQLENFLVSPHTAWYSEQSAVELKRKAAEEAIRFIKGEAVHYPINHL